MSASASSSMPSAAASSSMPSAAAAVEPSSSSTAPAADPAATAAAPAPPPVPAAAPSAVPAVAAPVRPSGHGAVTDHDGRTHGPLVLEGEPEHEPDHRSESQENREHVYPIGVHGWSWFGFGFGLGGFLGCVRDSGYKKLRSVHPSHLTRAPVSQSPASERASERWTERAIARRGISSRRRPSAGPHGPRPGWTDTSGTRWTMGRRRSRMVTGLRTADRRMSWRRRRRRRRPKPGRPEGSAGGTNRPHPAPFRRPATGARNATADR